MMFRAKVCELLGSSTRQMPSCEAVYVHYIGTYLSA